MATRECKEGHKYSSTESPQSESFSFLAAGVFTLYPTNKRERKRGVRFFYLTIPATVRMKRRERKRNKKEEEDERKGVESEGKKGSDGKPKGKGTRDRCITSRRTLC